MVGWLLRLAAASALGVGGWRLGTYFGDLWGPSGFVPWGLALLLAGVVIGGVVAPYLAKWIAARSAARISRVPSTTLLVAWVGLVMGLIAGALISFPLTGLPGWLGLAVPIMVSVAFGFLGAALLVSREEGILRLLMRGQHVPLTPVETPGNGQVLLDTSAIIDGRIADITKTGFLQGTLMIPRFVLDELRHIADSSDSIRRNRGRRGLEMLNKLRKEAYVPIQIVDTDVRDTAEVDGKLVKLARSLKAAIVTTDFNLNRVAEIQGVTVLNINELVNSLKPVVLPGEEMTVRVIQEGKEAGQGVAFLDDGTMVVVEGGKRFINSHLDIVVTRVLQTAAGRLIFAQPKGGER